MKNQYSKFIKYLEKQDSIFFQRSGDSVYLTDGKIVLKVPAMVYNGLIRPLSGILPDGLTDCKGAKRPHNATVEISSDSMDIEKAVASLNTEKNIVKTRFLVELPPQGRKKNEIARVFFSDGEIIAVNENYIDMVSDCQITGVWTSSGKWNAPIIQKDDDFTIVIFPMKVDREIFEMWRGLK